MQGTFLHGLIMTAVVMLSGGLLDAIAQEVLAGESSSGQVSVSQKRKTEFYCAFSILGTIPKDGDLTVIGTTIFDTNVKGSAGAGLKAGIFPKFAGGRLQCCGKSLWAWRQTEWLAGSKRSDRHQFHGECTGSLSR